MTRTVLITEIIAPYRIPVFNALAQHEGIDLHVIFLAETDPALRKWRVYREEINFSFEVLPSWRWRPKQHNILVNRGVCAALKRADPKAIICGGYNYLASWQALRWARRNKVRFILWSESNPQDYRSGNSGVEWLKRRFASSCCAFVVPGKTSSDYLKSLGVGESGIYAAPNAVDNTFFAEHAEAARLGPGRAAGSIQLPKRFILCVSRFVSEKGIFDLLNAYAKLEERIRSDVGLVFAGDGPAHAELVGEAERICPGRVLFPGFLQREEVAILYGLAEMLVLPTHSDPWGLVVNEAMACGLPIIVTDVAGCSADLVDDGWNGYVVPARDSDKLSAAIASILQNPELKQQMGLRSTERIRHYSPEACASGLAAAACNLAGPTQ